MIRPVTGSPVFLPRRAAVARPLPEASGPQDSCQIGSAPPRRLKPDYLWEGTALPGPFNVVLRFAMNTLGLGKRAGLEPSPARDPQPQPLECTWTPGEMRALETRVGQGVEVGKKRLGGGRNGSFLVELSTGVCTVWKPRSYEMGGKQRDQLPEKCNQALRDVAAYKVDGFLGHLAHVPPAVASGLEGREGALSLFVPDCVNGRDLGEKEVVLKAVDEQEYRNIAVLDHVIGNLDRHGGNWVVDKQGHVVPIDHGLSFPLRNGAQGTHNFDFSREFVLNEGETARLNSFLLRRGEVREALGPLLEPEAIEAMFERVERLLVDGKATSWWRS